MKTCTVKMLACMAGDGFAWNVGDDVEVPEDEADRLVAVGFAAPASDDEDAVLPIRPAGRKAKGKKVKEATPSVPASEGEK